MGSGKKLSEDELHARYKMLTFLQVEESKQTFGVSRNQKLVGRFKDLGLYVDVKLSPNLLVPIKMVLFASLLVVNCANVEMS